MKLVLIYLLTFFLFLIGFQNVDAYPMTYDNTLFEYYGFDHNEAEFSFTSYVVINSKVQPTKYQIDSAIRKQMRYMLGLMRSNLHDASALHPSWTYNIIETKKNSDGAYAAKYVLKSKGVFKSGRTDYTFTLPYDPNSIFKASNGQCQDEKTEEPNYWYHWNPNKTGCPLLAGKHYFTVTAQLNRIQNTVQTFPEYNRLVDSNKTIKMTFFFGFSNYGFNKWTPETQEDWGAKAFTQQREFLLSIGFKEQTSDSQQIESLYKTKDGFIPYVQEYLLEGKFAKIRIRLVLSDTGFYHRSSAFHLMLKDALEKESVIIYDGHSGLGHNLDLAAIEKTRNFKFVFNKNYQVLFFGSCVPYSYYTSMFFDRKKSTTDPKGTLNLDIFSYGKESIFGNSEDHALTRALLIFAQSNVKLSFQDIIKSSPNYYFGINGDEDNPTSK